jgi:hypothetical protein
MAMGLHTRCGNEDNLWGKKGEKCGTVRSVEQLVRIADELGRAVATGKEAREVYKLDEHYSSAEETIAKIGFPPGRKSGQLGFTFHA